MNHLSAREEIDQHYIDCLQAVVRNSVNKSKALNIGKWYWWIIFCKHKHYDPWMRFWQENSNDCICIRRTAFVEFAEYIKAGFFHGGQKQSTYTTEKALRECGMIMTQFNFQDPRKSTPGSAEIDEVFRKYCTPKK